MNLTTLPIVALAVPMSATANRLLARCIVTSEGCWEWAGSRRNGYGRIWVDGRIRSVHRVAAAIWIDGFDYDSDLLVCHRCDNPPCFNPEHLFPGTAVDNMSDAARKGRLRRSDAPRETIYPRERACAVCARIYEPDGAHRGRSIVCSAPCLAEWRSVTHRAKRAAETARMRELLTAGATYRAVGERFGISAGSVHRRVNGRGARRVA